MTDTLFDKLRVAFRRGANWVSVNGGFDGLNKASYDYADFETSPVTAAERAVENYREPGEFGEGATVRRAEPVDWGSQAVTDMMLAQNRADKFEAVLRKIAAYDDAAANAYLRATGSYSAFDEPGAVEMARGVLEGVATPPPSSRMRGKPTIAVGTFTVTELYAGRTVESDHVFMEPADDLILLMDGADKRTLEDAQHDAVAAETELRIVRKELSALQQTLSQANVPVAKADIIQWRKDWLEENDPQDDTDCVTPFDRYLYEGGK